MKSGKRVYVVEDEPDILNLVKIHLERAGFEPTGFLSGVKFLEQCARKVPDLVILDLMLPDVDGLDICKRVKNSADLKNVPVIILSSRAEEMDRILGLELGADDYVAKPFSPRELVARVKAVLRRGGRKGAKSAGASDRLTRIGEVEIDHNKHEVTVNGQPVELTSTEFRILSLLTERVGWVYSRDQILEHLWGREKVVVDRTIDAHVKNIRKKLGAAGNLIRNVRGFGYKFSVRDK